MPMHDWTRVPAGVFHAFHNTWISDLQKALNDHVLPPEFYALGEQRAGRITQEAEDLAFYLSRQRSLVIRHSSGDRIVALIEILSPANKHTRRALDDLVDKLVAALEDGIHVLVIDALPPTPRDPDGIHGVIWDRLLAGTYQAPADDPLTLVSYAARQAITAYVEPFHVGQSLMDMPLFLQPDRYVLVPLETTYSNAWSGVPHRWRTVIEAEGQHQTINEHGR
jgi:hypothetical protein